MSGSYERGGRVKYTRKVLDYRVEKFERQSYNRSLLISRSSLVPSLSVSIYEASLWASPKRRTGSASTMIQHLAYIFSWAENNAPNFEKDLFKGKGLSFSCIKKFLVWLENRVRKESGEELSRVYINQILSSCKCFVVWCVCQYGFNIGCGSNSELKKDIDSHHFAWDKVIFSSKKDYEAPDLTDEQLEIIETYLKDRVSSPQRASSDFRDYVMWRVMREFGIRIGELLALRLEDISFVGAFPHLKIVRLDERGPAYKDPRIPYEPKVKTLSRDLGFIIPDTDLIDLLDDYISLERVSEVHKNDEFVRSTFLSHQFVFLSYGKRDLGMPMSMSACQKLARKISIVTGIKFHWHLMRHAFFNRMYGHVAKRGMDATSLDDMIYWGGWSSEESLKMYNRREVGDRAKSGLFYRNKAEVCNEN